jgi:hypothetical protein
MILRNVHGSRQSFVHKISRKRIERTPDAELNEIAGGRDLKTRSDRGFAAKKGLPAGNGSAGIDRTNLHESSKISLLRSALPLGLPLEHLSAVPRSCTETSGYSNDVTTIRAPCNQHVTTVIIYGARRMSVNARGKLVRSLPQNHLDRIDESGSRAEARRRQGWLNLARGYR